MWSLRGPELRTLMVDEELERFVRELDGRANLAAIRELGLDGYLSAAIFIADETPALAFEPPLLQRLADLDLVLDLDLYLVPTEEPDDGATPRA